MRSSAASTIAAARTPNKNANSRPHLKQRTWRPSGLYGSSADSGSRADAWPSVVAGHAEKGASRKEW